MQRSVDTFLTDVPVRNPFPLQTLQRVRHRPSARIPLPRRRLSSAPFPSPRVEHPWKAPPFHLTPRSPRSCVSSSFFVCCFIVCVPSVQQQPELLCPRHKFPRSALEALCRPLYHPSLPSVRMCSFCPHFSPFFVFLVSSLLWCLPLPASTFFQALMPPFCAQFTGNVWHHIFCPSCPLPNLTLFVPFSSASLPIGKGILNRPLILSVFPPIFRSADCVPPPSSWRQTLFVRL